MAPPLAPAQLHDHGPLPVTANATPVEHRLVAGAPLRLAPFDAPQMPLTGSGMLHEAVVPPFPPAQFQVVVVPLSVALDEFPAAQLLTVTPHAPFTAAGLSAAMQLAFAPPLPPPQLHVQGPLPLTDDAVPAAQRLAAGALGKAAPLDDPHAPFTAPREPATAKLWVRVLLAVLDSGKRPISLTHAITLWIPDVAVQVLDPVRKSGRILVGPTHC